MDNQKVLNEYVKTDERNFYNLLIARQLLEGLSGDAYHMKRADLMILSANYGARQEVIKKNTETTRSGFQKAYDWLVNKFGGRGEDKIGVIPFIPIAIIAAVAYLTAEVSTTYIAKKEEAKRDLGVTDKLVTAIASEADPEVKAEIARRLNIKVAPSGGFSIKNLITAAVVIYGLAQVAQLLKKNG